MKLFHKLKRNNKFKKFYIQELRKQYGKVEVEERNRKVNGTKDISLVLCIFKKYMNTAIFLPNFFVGATGFKLLLIFYKLYTNLIF